jgi:hypothetical protein
VVINSLTVERVASEPQGHQEKDGEITKADRCDNLKRARLNTRKELHGAKSSNCVAGQSTI